MLLSQWALLGFAMWTVLLVVVAIGAPRLIAISRKEAKPSSFNPAVPHGSERYQRSMRAHANCVENLPVFATLVLLGGALGVGEAPFQLAAFCVLPARVLQSVAHVASGRNRAVLARFTFYSVQLVCFGIMGVQLLAHGLR
jgi:uncharacterized MAPEG superfamily protein